VVSSSSGVSSRCRGDEAGPDLQAHPGARLEAALGLAALPLGSLERGSRLRDVSFGAAPLELAVGYQPARTLSVLALLAYAPSVPTLCATASECMSSVGRDVILGVRVRKDLARRGRAVFSAGLTVAYEWFTSKLASKDVTSARSFAGPMLGLEGFAGFRLAQRWRLGPYLGVNAGRFVSSALATPSWESSDTVAERTFHAWPVVGARIIAAP
jgi:hypothetical protein